MQLRLYEDDAPPADERIYQRAPAHELRDYQVACVDAVRESLEAHRSCLVVMATGLGKTQCFAAIARDWPGRVLVLAHRDELVMQARTRLEMFLGEPVGVEKGAGHWSQTTDRVVVGSVQTVQREARMAEMGDFSLVIVDEAHHYTAPTFRRPLEYFSGAKVLGVTATPDRSDEQALGQIFRDVAFEHGILDGIDGGWLVPIVARRVVVEEIDLSDVGKDSFGDLAAGKLDKAMVKAVEGIVAGTLKHEPDRTGIGFFPGVQSAELAAQVWNRYRPGTAISISGETPPDERRMLVADFRRGKYQMLMNCQIATEGADFPEVSLVVQGRPTLSRALYSQMVGRGIRTLPDLVDGIQQPEWRRKAIAESAKPNCVVLDFVGNADKHDLVSMADVLGGDYTPAELAEAKKREKKAGDAPTDARKLLEESRAMLRAIAESQQARVTTRAWEVNPFKTLGVSRDSVNFLDTRYGFRPMTPKQRDGLLRLGFSERELEGIGFRGASALYNKVGQRIEKRLASFKQLRWIRKYAPCPDSVSAAVASKAIDHIKASGNRPDAARLAAILEARREPGEEG